MRYLHRLLLIVVLSAVLLKQIPVNSAAQTPTFQMEVGQMGQKTGTFSVGNRHRWFIRIDLPESLERNDDFSVLQTLSPALSLDSESIHAKILQQNEGQILLRMGDHYQVTAGSVFVENGISDRFQVCMTPEGIEFLAAYQSAGAQLLIDYTARINEMASMGTQIIGCAQLDQTNSEGGRRLLLSDKAAAATGGICISLSSSAGKPLSEERFMLAREANQKERDDPNVLKEILDTGNEDIVVVYEQFYTSADMLEDKVDIAVTDESGRALCYGLAYGTYYLVQMESRRSDILSSEPVKITIDEASHITAADGWKDGRGNPVDHTVYVTNSVLVMPQTGGIGTLPFTASGITVISCACLLLWYNKRKLYV